MTKRIFRSVILTALAVFLACLALVMGALYSYFSARQEKQLGTELELAAAGVEADGLSYIKSLGRRDGLRLTWVDADGTVIYDSNADAASMENHASREEIAQALETGSGEGSRVSATLSEKTVYLAQRLSDGTVIRAAASHYTVPTLLLGILQPLLLIIILALALSAFLASRLSKRIVGPLNSIDLDHPLENETYDELSPLLTRVERQQRQIRSQLDELGRRRREFEAVTGSMSEGLILLDKGGGILSINPAASKIFGASEDCVGRDILTVDRSPELRGVTERAHEGIRAEATIERMGLEYRLTASPVSGGGAVLLVFDVTEHNRAERIRREFTANVSHELKTPLHSIMGAAELLETGLVKPGDEHDFYSRIRSEASRLLALIEDVIDLSRMDEGESFPVEETDLHELAEEVAAQLEPEAKKREIELRTEGGPAKLCGVRRLLWEIIWNLADNAVKYGKERGHVVISTEAKGGSVKLRVRDDGPGIPPEHQPRVFERFYRVDKSHSKATGGTGLGLSIVKHAAQYHKGSISLWSDNSGTEITVEFPINRQNTDK